MLQNCGESKGGLCWKIYVFLTARREIREPRSTAAQVKQFNPEVQWFPNTGGVLRLLSGHFREKTVLF